jgi:DNA polymerase
MVWADTYGGKICENVVQACARDIMADALVKLDAAGYTLVATVHDEVIIEHDADDADLHLIMVESIMRTNNSWSDGLPLGVEGFTSVRYKK